MNLDGTQKRALAAFAVIIIAFLAGLFLLTGSSNTPPVKTSAATTPSSSPNLAGSGQTSTTIGTDNGSVSGGKYTGTLLSFPIPAGYTGLVQTVGGDTEEVRFSANNVNVRVRTQTSVTESLATFAQTYASQGAVSKSSYGGRTYYVVTVKSSQYDSLLAMTTEDGQLIFVQAITKPSDLTTARQMLAQIAGQVHLDKSAVASASGQ